MVVFETNNDVLLCGVHDDTDDDNCVVVVVVVVVTKAVVSVASFTCLEFNKNDDEVDTNDDDGT